jgi:hypothetical protein
MKKGVLALLPVFLINLVSAQFFSGYGRFSITDLFYSIDPPTMTLGLLFLIFFAFTFFVLGRVFKDSYGEPNKGIAGTIAFAVSALIIYGLWSSGFDLTDIFYSLGFSADALYFMLPVIILLASLLIIWKFRIRGFLMIFGLFIMILTIFTEVIYEKGIAFAIGAVLFGIGLWLTGRGRAGLSAVGRGTWGAAKGVGRGAKWARNRYKFENYSGVFRNQKKKAERMQRRHENLEEIRASKQHMHELKGSPPTKWAKKKYGKEISEKMRELEKQMVLIGNQIKDLRRNRKYHEDSIKNAVSPQQAAVAQKAISSIDNELIGRNDQLRTLGIERAELLRKLKELGF